MKFLKALKKYPVLIILFFSFVSKARALDPNNVALLQGQYPTSVTYLSFIETFKKVATAESLTRGAAVSVAQVVKELQEQDRDFAARVIDDQDFFKTTYLLDKGWNWALVDSRGLNLLHAALLSAHEPCLQAVLRAGAWKYLTEKSPSLVLAEVGFREDHFFAGTLIAWSENPQSIDLVDGIPAEYEAGMGVKIDGKSRKQREQEARNPVGGGMNAPAPQNATFATVEVPYATNRAFNAGVNIGTIDGASKYFAYGLSAALSYGVASVSIPPTHKSGKLEDLGVMQFKYDPNKHVTLMSLNEMNETDFFKDLASRVADRKNKFQDDPEASKHAEDLFIYVHGFNVDFTYAMRKTAQLMYDMDFPGVGIAFSWPARLVKVPIPSDFRSDKDRANASIEILTEFLTKIKAEHPEKKIHIIAHSLGTHVLSNVLLNIAKSQGPSGVKKWFSEVILAAPAIDAEIFTKKWAAEITPLCERMSILASDDDWALKVQSLAEDDSFTMPLGLWTDQSAPIVRGLGIRNFDASLLSTGTFSLDHSVYSEVQIAIEHMAFLIKNSPQDDSIVTKQPYLETIYVNPSVSNPDVDFWRFKKINGVPALWELPQFPGVNPPMPQIPGGVPLPIPVPLPGVQNGGAPTMPIPRIQNGALPANPGFQLPADFNQLKPVPLAPPSAR